MESLKQAVSCWNNMNKVMAVLDYLPLNSTLDSNKNKEKQK